MFVVVIENVIAYVGSWSGANGFGQLSLPAGERPVVRRARTGEAAAYRRALRSGQPSPAASA
ncbi:MAG: hypothetical protein PVG71_10600 [Anaerolineae bacterium]|jgi:hypothetical protein